eukprot:scaffold118078_cov63-Phaeocystis_antarctica.AAC.3
MRRPPKARAGSSCGPGRRLRAARPLPRPPRQLGCRARPILSVRRRGVLAAQHAVPVAARDHRSLARGQRSAHRLDGARREARGQVAVPQLRVHAPAPCEELHRAPPAATAAAAAATLLTIAARVNAVGRLSAAGRVTATISRAAAADVEVDGALVGRRGQRLRLRRPRLRLQRQRLRLRRLRRREGERMARSA